MSGRLAGKVALITGAARGQGREHSVRLAAEGADIIAFDICAPIRNVPYAPSTPDDLEQTAKLVADTGRRIVTKVVDTRDLSALRAATDEAVGDLGKLDVVVANAGICIMAPWNEVTPEIFRDTVEVNLFGTWNTIMVTAPHLIRNDGGSMILTSSAAGLKGLPFLNPYVASKHAITGLARAFAAELGTHNIRVNSLHPAGVETPMGTGDAIAALQPAMEANPRVEAMYSQFLAVGNTDPSDQANAVVYLASDEARCVTALAMTVDCGMTQY
jgi:SDR family mycofactocin-dependent oxidoreductase